MSGSSGRDSQQNIPKQFGEESRANTMPQRTSAPPQFSLPTRIDTSGNMNRHRTGAPHTVGPHTSRESELFTSREKTNEDKIKAQDESRDQPSWFLNPTPVAEEEAFHWGEHSNSIEHSAPPVPSIPAYQQELLFAPEHTGPASERGSNEISFYDASEGTSEPLEPAENNDWVMVSPEQELTNVLPQQLPEDPLAQSEPEPSQVPSSSILNRPRGSTIEELSPPLPTNPTKTYPPAMTPTAIHSAPGAEPPKQGDSSFLPLIRRTSTLGVGFGPRQKKPRFATDDEDETSISSMDKSGSEALGSEVAAIGTATTARGISARDVGRPRPDSETWPQEESPRILHKIPVAQPASQPNMPLHNETTEDSYQQPMQIEPSKYHQSITVNGEPEQSHEQFSALPAAHLPMGSQDPRSSEESIRPNLTASSKAPPTQWSESTVARTTWDPQRNRGMSGSSQNLPRSNGSFIERPPLAGYSSQIKSFEQPPSSASRYPDLFRPEQPPRADLSMYGDDVVHAGSSDLPSHLYQQPIPREDAFLPRQQGAEYQIEGVGPPVDEPSSATSRRNSGFFRELGGRISRGTSRERRNSISREDGFSSARNFESPENGHVEPSIASEEGKEKKHRKQRSSFMGHLTRASTGVLGTPKTPETRDSMVTHPSGSRVDLTASKQESFSPKGQTHPHFYNGPVEPKQPERAATSLGMGAEPGKKKRFSGLTGFFARPGNLPRASLPTQARQKPQNIRKVSYGEQPMIAPLSEPRKAPSPPEKNVQPQTYPPSNYRPPTSPNYPTRSNNYQPLASDHYQPPSPKRVIPATATRAPSQSRNIFSVLANNNNASSSPDSRKENKKQTRRPSAAGLLNEFMGRKTKQVDWDKEDSRSQGSQSQLSQSQSGRQALPRAQTYTDLQEREQEMQPRQQSIEQPIPQIAPQKQRSASRQDSSHQDRDRGRRISREPQYDSVPIPGGYSLVRGQGAMTVPTDYDPRGFNRAPQPDPRYGQPQNWAPSQYPSPPTQGQPQQYFNGYQYQTPSPQQYNDGSQYQIPSPQQTIPSPSNGQEPRHAAPTLAIESFDHSMNPILSHSLSFSPASHPDIQPSERRHSRDLARSPARAQEGQQPPYQLSLPGDTSADEDEKPLPTSKDDPIIITPLSSPPKHNSIKRLQQPIIQHPGSPASYAIPDSTFSPVNPGAVDMPPPPPPKSPPSNFLDAQYRPGHTHTLSADDSLNLSLDLDRSNTRRTAVSAVSVMSSPSLPPDSAGLTVPNISQQRGLDGSPSPSPPTPDFERGRRDQRGTSREAQSSDAGTIVQTVLETPAVSDHDDIYDASPRLPKLVTPPTVRSNPSPVTPTGAGAGPSNLEIGKEHGSGSRSRRPEGKENEHTAELDNTDQERYRVAREEKIFYDGGVSEGAEPSATMSATSYPGQEWNPYSGVAVDDLNWYE